MKSMKIMSLIVSGLVGLSLTAANAQALKLREKERVKESTREKTRELDRKLEEHGQTGKSSAEREIQSGVTINKGSSSSEVKLESRSDLGLVQTQVNKESCSMSAGLRVMSDAMTAADSTIFNTTMVSTVDLAKANGFETIIDGPVLDSSNQKITLLNTGEVADFLYKNNLTDSALRQGGQLIAEKVAAGITANHYSVVGEFKVPTEVVELFEARMVDENGKPNGKEQLRKFCQGRCDTFSTGVKFCKDAA